MPRPPVHAFTRARQKKKLKKEVGAINVTKSHCTHESQLATHSTVLLFAVLVVIYLPSVLVVCVGVFSFLVEIVLLLPVAHVLKWMPLCGTSLFQANYYRDPKAVHNKSYQTNNQLAQVTGPSTTFPIIMLWFLIQTA